MSKVKLNLCGQITKITFIAINLIYLLIGLALVGLGSYLINSGHDLDFFTGNNVLTGAAIFIAIGIIIFLITLLGLVGAFFQHRFLLYIYLAIVVIVIVLEIVATILGYVYRDTITDTTSNRARDAIFEYLPSNETNYKDDVNKAIDFIQKQFECCGWNDTDIWLETNYYAITNMYPKSCECPNNNNSTDCRETVESGQLIYNTPCEDGVSDSVKRGVVIVGGVGVFFAVLQLVPILLTVALIYTIHKAHSGYVTV